MGISVCVGVAAAVAVCVGVRAYFHNTPGRHFTSTGVGVSVDVEIAGPSARVLRGARMVAAEIQTRTMQARETAGLGPLHSTGASFSIPSP